MARQIASFSALPLTHLHAFSNLAIHILKLLLTPESNALNIGDVMRIIKLKEVLQKTGLGRTTMYGLIKSLNFPQSIPLGLRAVGWLDSEVDAWIKSRLDARDRRSS